MLSFFGPEMSLSSSENFLALAAKDRIHIWEKQNGTLVRLWESKLTEYNNENILAFDFVASVQGRSQLWSFYFCICTAQKKLLLWKCDKPSEITEISSEGLKMNLLLEHTLEKQATLVKCFPQDSFIILADRFGHVHRIPMMCSAESERSKLLLGHLSIVLDFDLHSNGAHLATADRDERIRVSAFPNTYNIESFCLGHTDYVKSVKFLGPTTLVSFSADGTLKFWNFTTGNCDCTVEVKALLPPNVAELEPLCVLILDKHFVVVTFQSVNFVLLYKVKYKSVSDSGAGETEVVEGVSAAQRCELNGIVKNAVALESNKIVLLLELEENLTFVELDVNLDKEPDAAVCIVSTDVLIDKELSQLCQEQWERGSLPLRKAGNFGNLQEYMDRKHKRIDHDPCSSKLAKIVEA